MLIDNLYLKLHSFRFACPPRNSCSKLILNMCWVCFGNLRIVDWSSWEVRRVLLIDVWKSENGLGKFNPCHYRMVSYASLCYLMISYAILGYLMLPYVLLCDRMLSYVLMFSWRPETPLDLDCWYLGNCFVFLGTSIPRPEPPVCQVWWVVRSKKKRRVPPREASTLQGLSECARRLKNGTDSIAAFAMLVRTLFAFLTTCIVQLFFLATIAYLRIHPRSILQWRLQCLTRWIYMSHARFDSWKQPQRAPNSTNAQSVPTFYVPRAFQKFLCASRTRHRGQKQLM